MTLTHYSYKVIHFPVGLFPLNHGVQEVGGSNPLAPTPMIITTRGTGIEGSRYYSSDTREHLP